MEGFTTDSVVPLPLLSSQLPPSPSSHQPLVAMADTRNSYGKRTRRRAAADRSDTLVMERDRRLKMNHLFSELQSTIPGLLPKVTREVIVNETINYIKNLEKKKKRLEELKGLIVEPDEGGGGGKLMLPCTSNNNNSSITVTVSGNVAFFGIQSKARFGLITVIFKVFYQHHAEILAANVSVNNGELTLAITALLVHYGDDDNGNVIAEKIKTEILGL